MNDILVGKSAQEWFRERVGDVLAHRRIRVQAETEFYLVNLLASFLEKERLFVEDEEGVHAEPLALVLLRALQADRRARARGLRRLGDTALFVSGFFADSISRRSAVDVGYYMAMGERAYGALRDTEKGGEALFGELADRFQQFVDLFAEIAETSQLRSNRGLVKLYERFLLTRDARVAELLRERGVALFGGPARRKDLPH